MLIALPCWAARHGHLIRLVLSFSLLFPVEHVREGATAYRSFPPRFSSAGGSTRRRPSSSSGPNSLACCVLGGSGRGSAARPETRESCAASRRVPLSLLSTLSCHVPGAFLLPFPTCSGHERMAYFLPTVRSSSALAASWSQRRVQDMLFVAISGGRRTLSSETPRSASEAPAAGDTAAADSMPDPRSQRVLHAAVAGLPNAGKSTLLNYMVGDKVRHGHDIPGRCGCRCPVC